MISTKLFKQETLDHDILSAFQMADRLAFGFYNPNHAAAMICALFPFCWGWGVAHTSSDRLRGALRSGDTSARVLPSLRKSKVIARLLKGWFGILLCS